jgi:parvulin-like peptidyl-prolyl isomerase
MAEYSDDERTKSSDGNFGLITARSAYPDTFKQAVFALKPGEFTDPLKQSAAFFVFRLEEQGVQPLSEASEDVIQEMKTQHINEWMQDLTKRFEPTVENPKFFTPANASPLPVLPAK